MGTSHPLSVGSNNHAITANPNATGAPYADIAARDADTAFQVTANINKLVRVESPAIEYFSLLSVGPAVWSNGVFDASGVDGPASATDNALARFDGATGKLIQNSLGILSDAGALSGLIQLDVDNLRLDGNTLSTTDTNGNLLISPNGTGQVDFEASDLIDISQLNVDNIRLDGNTISSQDTNGNVTLDPNGSGVVDVSTSLISNVVDPVSAQDAATKNYVDTTGGFVVGPASAIDNAIARFNLTTGKLIQSSNVLIDDSDNVSGAVDFTTSGIIKSTKLGANASSALQLEAAGVGMRWRNTAAAVDGRNWDMSATGNLWDFTVVNDADTVSSQIMLVSRTGTTIDSISFPSATIVQIENQLQVQKTGVGVNAAISVRAVSPSVALRESDVAVDEKSWNMGVDAKELSFRAFNDAATLSESWLSVVRGTGITINTVTFPNGEVTIANQLNLTQSGAGTTSALDITSNNPSLEFFQTNASVDNKCWDITAFGEALLFRVLNDANTVVNDYMSVQRTGGVVDSVTFPNGTIDVTNLLTAGSATVTGLVNTLNLSVSNEATFTKSGAGDGSAVSLESTNPTIQLRQTNAPLNEKSWDWTAFDSKLVLRALNDASTSTGDFITFERSGFVPTKITFPTPIFFTNERAGLNTGVNFEANAPGWVINELDAAVDNRKWDWVASLASLDYRVLNDADTVQTVYMRVGRSGTTVSSLTFTATNSIFIGEIVLHNEKPDTHPLNTIQIRTASDLTDLATAGVITIAANTKYVQKTAITNPGIRFQINAGFKFIWDFEDTGSFIHDETSTLFSSQGNLEVLNGTLTRSSTGKLLSWTPIGILSTIKFDKVTLDAWDFGDVDMANLSFLDCIILNHAASLVITNFVSVRIFNLAISRFTATVNLPVFDFQSSNPKGQINFDGCVGNLPTTEAMFKFFAGLGNLSRTLISNATWADGPLFVDTTGASGAYTAVSDQGFTATAITSVTNSSGLARFNFTPGPTLFVGQEVITSTFAIPLYNNNIIITAVGAGFFEAQAVPFFGGGTGSFLGNAIELTETTTTTSNGLGIQLDTTDATDYDFAGLVFNKQTNSFRVSLPFGATRAGTWTTKTLDEASRQVLVSDSPRFKSSMYIAEMRVKANTTVMTITDGAYVALDVASQPATIENEERFKLLNASGGIVHYAGRESIRVQVTFNVWGKTASNDASYLGSLGLNGVTPIFATAPSSPLEVKTTRTLFVVTQIFELNPAGTVDFQLFIAGDGSSEDLTITELVMTVEHVA